MIDDQDPEGAGRLLVELAPGSASWARVVVPIGSYGPRSVAVGAEVWVAFSGEGGADPVVLGLVHAPTGHAAATLQREALGDAWDRGHASGANDGSAGGTRNPYR